MTAFVLDNSVSMCWFFENQANSYADGVLQQVANGAALVPVLWRYEISAVLAKAQRAGIVTAPKAEEFLTTLNKLNISVDPDSWEHILTDVYRLAVAYRITSYDASYLELALRKNLPLATLDQELITASRAAGVALL